MQEHGFSSSPNYPVAPRLTGENSPPSSAARRRVLFLLAAVALAGSVAAGLIICVQPGSQGRVSSLDPFDMENPAEFLSSIPPYAINKPATYGAKEVQLADQEPVIGVSVAGKHRAYLVRVMAGSPSVHTINDLISGCPVSVTYCDRSDCTRVFTSDRRDAPLNLTFGGQLFQKMLIRTGENAYDQETLRPLHRSMPPFPYAEMDYEATFWKDWKDAHPDTDVYIGVDVADEP